MVVVQYGEDAVENAVVDLSKADVDAEYKLYEEVEEDVELVLHEGADSLFVFPPYWCAGGRLLNPRYWEVGFYELLALEGREVVGFGAVWHVGSVIVCT